VSFRFPFATSSPALSQADEARSPMAPPIFPLSAPPFFANVLRVRAPDAGAHSTPTAVPAAKAKSNLNTVRPVLAIMRALLEDEVYRPLAYSAFNVCVRLIFAACRAGR
jgi:hypothetical protein